jgi:hypothetical protein
MRMGLVYVTVVYNCEFGNYGMFPSNISEMSRIPKAINHSHDITLGDGRYGYEEKLKCCLLQHSFLNGYAFRYG